MKNLYLHVGAHKTGSTSIQNFMHDNRAALAREGILYPQIGLEGKAHHRIAWATGIGLHEVDEAFLLDAFSSIAREAVKSGCHSIILSSEEFESTHETHLLAPLLDHFEVKIVMYLRKQDHYLESTYNQHVRLYDKRFDGSIYQLALKYNFFNHFNYRRLTGRWESVFGRENILIRPYGTEHVERDARKDILSILRADSGRLLDKASKSDLDNISLATSAVPYMARINREKLSYRQHQKALTVLADIVPPIEGARLLSNWESMDFYDKFEQGNEYIADRYLGLNGDPFAVLTRKPEEEIHIRHCMVEEALLQQALAAVGDRGRHHAGVASPGFLRRRLNQSKIKG